ncbi:hypothetical protein [Staphylococcus gallinarum]|uniref:hypothetical protein n=1 Tax=Staphylococcus gallinarum TaxID=1293 RepID=UPI0030C4C81E
MSRSVKFAVSIYLTVVAVLCCSYLIMILIGTFHGNDMRGAVLDADNNKNVENINKNNNSKEATTSETSRIPKDTQSFNTQNNAIQYEKLTHTWSVDSTKSTSHV